MLRPLEIGRRCASQATGRARLEDLAGDAEHNPRAVAQRMPGRGEDLAVDIGRLHDSRNHIQPSPLQVRNHLAGIFDGTDVVVGSVHNVQPGGAPPLLLQGGVPGMPNEANLLGIPREEGGTGRVAAVAGIQPAPPRSIEGNVITQLGHAAQVDHGGEGVRRELVGHEGDIPSARAPRGENPPTIEFDSRGGQPGESVLQGPQGVERLQPAKVIRFGSLDRIFRARLQIVDAQGNAVAAAGQFFRLGGADTVAAAPVVQGQEQAGLGGDPVQPTIGIADPHPHRPRTGAEGPRLSGDLVDPVRRWQRGPLGGQRGAFDQSEPQGIQPPGPREHQPPPGHAGQPGVGQVKPAGGRGYTPGCEPRGGAGATLGCGVVAVHGQLPLGMHRRALMAARGRGRGAGPRISPFMM